MEMGLQIFKDQSSRSWDDIKVYYISFMIVSWICVMEGVFNVKLLVLTKLMKSVCRF